MPRRKSTINLSTIHQDLDKTQSILRVMSQQLSNIQSPITKLGTGASTFPNIPPRWVLQAAHKNLDLTHHWAEYFHVLADYYGIQRVKGAFVDATIKPDRIAEYRREEKAIYSRANDMTEHTALHEFWHHLVGVMNLTTRGEEEQALANAFADACLEVQKTP